jgi:hypothetical protein
MEGDRTERAMARIEAALARIEAAAARHRTEPAGPADHELQARHDALRQTVNAVLTNLDSLIAETGA